MVFNSGQSIVLSRTDVNMPRCKMKPSVYFSSEQKHLMAIYKAPIKLNVKPWLLTKTTLSFSVIFCSPGLGAIFLLVVHPIVLPNFELFCL